MDDYTLLGFAHIVGFILLGGVFYFNYPGGTGLMNGAIFGRLAGTSAGAIALKG